MNLKIPPHVLSLMLERAARLEPDNVIRRESLTRMLLEAWAEGVSHERAEAKEHKG